MVLVGVGLSQAALMIAGAYAVGRFLSAETDQMRLMFLFVMLLFGILALLAHAGERWLAEWFGQNYVAVCRVRLLKAIVRSGGRTSRHGIAMTRLITDLSSIKNWVAQGIAGGTAHVAGLFGLIIGAWLISPPALLAIAAASLVSSLLAAAVVIPLRRRIREARAVRGALSARVGEAVLTAPSIRNLGLLDRRKKEIYKYSVRLSEKLSVRYGLAGLLRHSPELGFLLGIATLGFVASQGQASGGGGTATSVLILAAAATSLRQLAQSLDLWLSYAEGLRRLATALDGAGPSAKPWRSTGPLGVSCHGARPTVSSRRSSFDIDPEDHIALPATATVKGLLRVIAGLDRLDAGSVTLLGSSCEKRLAKRTSGAALLIAPDVPLQRGTIRSNLTAASPDVDERRLFWVAQRCGLLEDDAQETSRLEVAVDEAGQGLSPSLTARLQLARAILASPGVLLVDDPIFEIDTEVRQVLNQVLLTERLTVLIAVNGETPPIPVHRSLREDHGRLVEDPVQEEVAPSADNEPRLIQMVNA
jgi:ABC-type multidrug transport system fused ATPase/permease subunit